MAELGQGSGGLREQPQWSPLLRKAAVVLWAGFLGAVMLVLALLMGFETLQSQAEGPGFGLLAAAFGVGWLVSTLTSVMTISLALEPRPRLQQTHSE